MKVLSFYKRDILNDPNYLTAARNNYIKTHIGTDTKCFDELNDAEQDMYILKTFQDVHSNHSYVIITDETIPVAEMKSGCIAIITEWNDSSCIGKLVLRWHDDLIFINDNDGYTGFFNIQSINHIKGKIKLLKKGDVIKL